MLSRVLSSVFLLLSTVSGFSQSRDIRSWSWIAGDWQSVTPQGTIEEHWTQPAGNCMIGMSRTVREGKTTSFEYLRLELRDRDMFYIASPNGCKQAEFKLVESDSQRLAFEGGDEHVQRVVYHKEGRGLAARIEGQRNGKPFTVEVHYVSMRAR